MGPRLAVRAVIVVQGKVLLVNAYPGARSDLWCAPGGGVMRGSSLHDNLIREVFEETGMAITVGAPCLINEFHDPTRGFHQVEVFFRCAVQGDMPKAWQDTEGVVNRQCWATADQMADLRVKPDRLRDLPWEDTPGMAVDPLELIVP